MRLPLRRKFLPLQRYGHNHDRYADHNHRPVGLLSAQMHLDKPVRLPDESGWWMLPVRSRLRLQLAVYRHSGAQLERARDGARARLYDVANRLFWRRMLQCRVQLH
jgi:hypothetical protein